MARKKGEWRSERCLTCAHNQIGEINFAICKGVPILAVAKKYDLTPASVYNHNRHHIPENYRKIIGAGIYKDIDELLKSCVQGDAESLDVLNAMISGFFHNWSLAFAAGSQTAMVAYSSQVRQLIELRARINRELAPAQHLHGHLTTNNFVVDNSAMIAGISKALQPYPDARRAVLQFLRPEVNAIEHQSAAD